MAGSTLTTTRLALPKGKLLGPTSEFISAMGLGFDDYNSKTRIYRLQSQSMPSLTAKMLNERDIPVQVAIGNYDFGICSSDWLQELQARYPASGVFKLADLNYDCSEIYLASTPVFELTPEKLMKSDTNWRIVTMYPALAEAAANQMRLRRFRVFPLWGAEEAYLPENADLAVIKVNSMNDLAGMNLAPVKRLCASNACIIASRHSLQTQDFSELLSRFTTALKTCNKTPEVKPAAAATLVQSMDVRSGLNELWLALADGHQQTHTEAFLDKTSIRLEGYAKDNIQRRPTSNLDWLRVKVIRPQDMPQQVANGNFDLAVTGEDWLLDHLYQFPSSPVEKLLDLGFGRVRIVAVISEDVPASSIEEIRALMSHGRFNTLRIASEYVNISDKYLRDKHIARYRVIPTWGATEVYLPEDADILLENTETGQTLLRHKLKIIDTLFESTACLIVNSNSLQHHSKKVYIEQLVKIFKEGLTAK